MAQAPRSGSGRNDPRGSAGRNGGDPRGAAGSKGGPRGAAAGGAGAGKAGAGRAGGAGAGKPGAGRTGGAGVGKAGAGRAGGAGAGKAGAGNSRSSRSYADKPAGAKAFGNERFGKNLGPVRKSPAKNGPAKKGNAPISDQHNPDGVRLQKIMAQARVASRRVCEEMIEEGRVEVDGAIVTELGMRVNPDEAVIHVDGLRIQLDEAMVYYVFNKPQGVVSTMEDPDGRKCISNFLRKGTERLFHVGRLDVETEGLLLLTNDGELTNRLTHPSYEVPKTYLVQVRGPMPHGIGNRMKEGVDLEDGTATVDSFRLVDSTPGHLLVEVVLHSGRNRIVRRMFDAVGFPVQRLVRVKVGPIALGDQRQGTIRALGRQEVGHLMASVGM